MSCASHKAGYRVRQKNTGSWMGRTPKVTLAINSLLSDLKADLILKVKKKVYFYICLYTH